MTAPVIAVVAIGDMGRGVAVRLREGGARVITCLSGRGDGAAARAKSASGEIFVDDEALVREAEAVLSIVPPGAAVELAERIDLFTGPGAASMAPLMGLNMKALTVSRVGDFAGCPPIDGGEGRRVAKAGE
jgi:prephenate dehydrogenase